MQVLVFGGAIAQRGQVAQSRSLGDSPFARGRRQEQERQHDDMNSWYITNTTMTAHTSLSEATMYGKPGRVQ